MITITNKFNVTFVDEGETLPGDAANVNYQDTSSDTLLKVYKNVPEMASGQTDWLASDPVLLFDAAEYTGLTEIKYITLKASMPIYVWFELPTLVPGVGGVDTPQHIKVRRFITIDGSVSKVYAINPAVFNSKQNDSVVKGFIAFVRP